MAAVSDSAFLLPFCISCQIVIFVLFLSTQSFSATSPHFPSILTIPSSLPYVPMVARVTALTCRPMFPWARGPLGACQQASLPATSGDGRMERALISTLKVNKATARHSASDSWAPMTGSVKYSFGLEVQYNHTRTHYYKF